MLGERLKAQESRLEELRQQDSSREEIHQLLQQANQDMVSEMYSVDVFSGEEKKNVLWRIRVSIPVPLAC